MQGDKVFTTWLHWIAASVVDAIMNMMHPTKQTNLRALELAIVDESIVAAKYKVYLLFVDGGGF